MFDGKSTLFKTFSGRCAKPGIARQVKGETIQFGGDSGSSTAHQPVENEFTRLNLAKFQTTLNEDVVDLDVLRDLAWKGVPSSARPVCWMLLTGYLPCNRDRRARDMQRKRQEYHDCVQQYYHTNSCINDDGTFPNVGNRAGATEEDITMRRQIHIDVPRTNPEVGLFHAKHIQKILERILYVWSVRHPASGYVQGLNDLVTPFLAVFLSPHIENVFTATSTGADVVCQQIENTSEEDLNNAEADSYWCFCKLLDNIQDHYTFAQPGIQKMVQKLKDLTARIDAPLHDHLIHSGVDFLQFSFRWMNCLLLRELPLPLAIRLWDTYLAEGDVFPTLHVYVCAVFLIHWSPRLLTCEFADMMLLLQALPSSELSFVDLDMLISKAYMWRELYEPSPNHLKSNRADNS